MRPHAPWLPVRLLAACGSLLLIAHAAQAQMPQPIPGEVTIPFYMQGFEEDPEDPLNGWTASIFYRPLETIPPDYNLYRLNPDLSLPMEPLLVEGFALPSDHPAIPRQVVLRRANDAVMPIYFVPKSEIRGATADGFLTLPELESLPSLVVGYVDLFHQVQHPRDAKGNYQVTIVASGALENGNPFRVKCTLTQSTYNVKIDLEP